MLHHRKYDNLKGAALDLLWGRVMNEAVTRFIIYRKYVVEYLGGSAQTASLLSVMYWDIYNTYTTGHEMMN